MASTKVDVRLLLLRLLAIAAMVGVGLRLWHLQILGSDEYRYQADRNRFRLIRLEAPRGIIYDRDGRILVRNSPSFTVSVIPAGLPQEENARSAVLAELTLLLEGAPGEPTALSAPERFKPGLASPLSSGTTTVIELLAQNDGAPESPVPIATNVDRHVAFVIEEQRLSLPGVAVEVEAVRHYLYGSSLGQVLGYIGPIPAESAEQYLQAYSESYQLDDRVGLSGIELVYETELRGRPGRKHVEVDAYEREVDELAVDPPQPGYNLFLSIDMDLQLAVEAALRDGMRAAREKLQTNQDYLCRSATAIVMNPQNGQILASVSLPGYDNNLFSNGIAEDELLKLSEDPLRPLVNHSIGGQYPPGSTFKPFVAAGALEEGTVTVDVRFKCEGTLLLPNKYFPEDLELAQTFHCWREQGHGHLNVVEAIQQSCDIYFYQLAGGFEDYNGLGIEKLAEYARLFGYGEPTGIDLSGESSGLVPSDQWKRQNYGESWVKGDTYNAAIGQGFVLATPLQVLNSTAAIANFGTLYRPQVMHRVEDADGKVVETISPEVIREIPVQKEYLHLIREGMREAVAAGTAWLLDIPEVQVAGKTGTAEYASFDDEGGLLLDEEGNLPTHSWFTAFAPYDNPEMALVLFIEGGGEGSQTAVPVAGEILRYYFGLPEHPADEGLELPVIQTD